VTALIAWLDASSDDQRRMREIVNRFANGRVETNSASAKYFTP